LTDWADWFCAAGIRASVPAGKMSVPADDYTHLRTGTSNCPSFHTCRKGIAYANFAWASDSRCSAAAQYDNPVVFDVSESQVGKTLHAKTQNDLKVKIDAADDISSNTVTYTITGYPDGCNTDRNPSGSKSPVSPDFLRISTEQNPSSSNLPSKSVGVLVTNQAIDKEVCASTYAAVIRATISSSSFSIYCYVAINILDVNEPPAITIASLSGHSVPEASPPGTLINPQLLASDPEADLDRQSLIWTITSCKAVLGSTETVKTTTGSSPTCEIRINSCDGQLMVADGAAIDYERYE